MYCSFASIGHADIKWSIVSSNCWQSLHLLLLLLIKSSISYPLATRTFTPLLRQMGRTYPQFSRSCQAVITELQIHTTFRVSAAAARGLSPLEEDEGTNTAQRRHAVVLHSTKTQRPAFKNTRHKHNDKELIRTANCVPTNAVVSKYISCRKRRPI